MADDAHKRIAKALMSPEQRPWWQAPDKSLSSQLGNALLQSNPFTSSLAGPAFTNPDGSNWLFNAIGSDASRLGNSLYSALMAPADAMNQGGQVEYNPQTGAVNPFTSNQLSQASNMANVVSTAPIGVPMPSAGLGMGMRAFHGTPHSFDKFDISKTGSGEGNGSFGRGLYFAENPTVAKTYQRNLRTGDAPGNLYEVDINAEPHHLLDWDKPIAQQSPQVQAKLQSLVDGLKKPMFGSDRKFVVDSLKEMVTNGTATGQEFYNRLGRLKTGSSGRDDAAASVQLHRAGIPGLKYLDQESRSKGSGTSNYVMFHHDPVKITSKLST